MQLALFGKRPLFEEDILKRRRAEWLNEPLAGFDNAAAAIRQFSREIRASRGKIKETALEQAFNQAFFVDLLGYQLYPGVEGSWTAWPKPPSSVLRLDGEPDLLLGTVGPEGFETLAVVELKRPGTPLEAPQPSYDNRSPVEQAFDYAQNLASCRWVIVSDMRFVRLYSVDTADEYHEIDLQTDAQDGIGALHEAYRLLGHDYLIVGAADSATSRLLSAARDLQAAFRDGFYRLYSDIRADLLVHIEAWSAGRFDRTEQVLAVQRLLDRLLFIFFCEDHPDRLLRNELVKGVTERAVLMPGPSTTKAYDQLKQLFRDLDVGADTKTWQVPRYNGELFKPHPIVDNLSLPDSLYEKRYSWKSPSGAQRVVNGAYGLHVFDFWRELDRDLLGNLFERSIGDLTALAHGGRPDARQAFGIFYTASRLARFVASSAVRSMLYENTQLASALTRAASGKNGGSQSTIDEIVEILTRYRVADLACGSGVFLTAAMNILLSPHRKAVEAVASGGLVGQLLSMKQAEVLKSCMYGADLLPQAVELAKLALWLTAARINEPSADLSSNFIVGDSLESSNIEALLRNAGGKFDLILGNPPWGGEFNRDKAKHILRDLGLETDGSWDSWEIFVALAAAMLRPGGRFALLVPDTLFSADKRRTREWLLRRCKLEKVYALGPDWFTADVRMGTVVIQAVTAAPDSNHRISTMVLAGRNRTEAQSGKRPLEQLEAALVQRTTQERCRHDEAQQIQVLASGEELELLSRIEARSYPLGDLSEHARGDEINADGLIWRCGNCGAYTVPGEKKKGGGYRDKTCPRCGATIAERDAVLEALIADTPRPPYRVPYVDGRSLTRRYETPVRRYMRTDIQPLLPPLKPDAVFKGPKVLIRQAGVGVAATFVGDNCRCPQSVYIYRVTDGARAKSYSEEFILACLVSRTMTYVIMKRFGEIDPARAFAKLTHARVVALPIPQLNTEDERKAAREVSAHVKSMLAKPEYGGEVDYTIEMVLRQLWQISSDEGRYINGFFSALPDGQAVRDLFPDGAPVAVPLPAPN